MKDPLVVKTTPDGLTATLEAVRRPAPQPELTVSDLERLLQRQGVVAGVIHERLGPFRDALAASADPVPPVVVAMGQKATGGADGRLEILVPLGRVAGKQVGDSDRVDFREREVIKNVVVGETIARIHPPTPGEAGWTVHGDPLPARPGVPARLPPLGLGVELSEDELSIVATKGGHLSIKEDGRLEIDEVYRLAGDVDFEVGNVHFRGPVEILGSVRQGFRVDAGSDLAVRGDVEDSASLAAQGTIRIAGSILSSAQRTRIEAGGGLAVGSVSGALLLSAGDVEVRGDALQTRIQSTGSVRVRGSVRGSHLEGVAGIEIEGDVGSEGGVRNVLVVGIMLEKHRERLELEERLEELEETANEMARQFRAKYGAGGEDGAPEPREADPEAKREWTERQDGLMKAIVEKRQRLGELLAELRYDPKAIAAVRGRILPACFVHCGEAEHSILSEPLAARMFGADPGGKRVVIAPYVSEKRRGALGDLAQVDVADPAQLRKRTQSGAIGEEDLARELERYLEEDGLVETVFQVGSASLKMKRYRTPEVMSRVAYAEFALSQRASDPREAGIQQRKALDRCRDVLKMSPRSVLGHSLLGRIHAAQGSDEKAVDMHRQAVQLAGQGTRKELVARAQYDQAQSLLVIARRSSSEGREDRARALETAARASLALALSADPEGCLAPACRRVLQPSSGPGPGAPEPPTT